MLNQLLKNIEKKYSLVEIPTNEFSELRVSGMKFQIKAYDAIGLGRVSIMKAKGFFGLMKMDTLMITPIDKDMPLLSYDRVKAFGNDVLIIELYNTLLEDCDLSCLKNIKDSYSNLNDHDLGSHWYDSIKFAESVSKKGKKESKEYDKLTLDYIQSYLNIESNLVLSKETKIDKSKIYVEGLLNNGGPSTSVFQKKIGKEKTEKLFKNILFGLN